MIISFADRDTEKLANHMRVKRFEKIERIAIRKLLQLEIAATLGDLSVPPGNRLELLTGDRKGQCSIRINEQYRICFVWTSRGAKDVEIVDYH
ncbi:MAG: type II toxin-antitoxin system RelE/ParE family toxin [Clostridiales Family XIII bacterium]|jgi:proteic killer suppression protein|nr:type II toxin-antitoxin system RelE/ParE family toxin [Clostridiales Family XIII bacterium]